MNANLFSDVNSKIQPVETNLLNVISSKNFISFGAHETLLAFLERQIVKKGMLGLTILKKFITEKEGEIQESVFKIRA